MKSKIFKHIFLVAMAVFVSCIALTMCSLYSYFSAEHNAEMKEEANYVAAAVEENGIDFLRLPAPLASPGLIRTARCSMTAWPTRPRWKITGSGRKFGKP